MITKSLTWLIRILIGVIFIGGLLFGYVNIAVPTPDKPFVLGTTFSSKYAEALGLDWREAYGAILSDLKVKNVRLPVYWEDVEPKPGIYTWDILDEQVRVAGEHGAVVTLAVGQKVPRWPECFVPEWARADDDLRQERLLLFIEETVQRYKQSPAVARWQVENEPFLKFGAHCPRFDVDLLDQEIALVRTLDPSRSVIITDSGEINPWIGPARRADIFGTTMYRNVYTQDYGYWEYLVGPRFFLLKKKIVSFLTGQKNMIVIELQTEPWMPGWITSFSPEEQVAAMDAARIRDNIEYARQGGFTEIMTWGVEWWYYLEKNDHDHEIWSTMRELFHNHAT